jgi:hypothetical protein
MTAPDTDTDMQNAAVEPEASISEPAHEGATVAAHEHAPSRAWPITNRMLPVEQLTDRELIARAEYCDQIAHTDNAAGQAAALRDLEAVWDEAERRAVGQPAVSLPAQVAGYIGLVREDDDHALAAEAAAWRQHLDAALASPGLGLELDGDQHHEQRREQLARWHEDDIASGRLDAGDALDQNEGDTGPGGAGWGR